MSKSAVAADVVERVAANDVLAFDHVVRKTEPYAHIVSPRFYTEAFAGTLLDWLEAQQDWHLKEGILFEQYELGFSRFTHCKEIEGLWDGAVLARLRDAVTLAIGQPVSGRINIHAHKLVPGQFTNIHTDMIPEETHRLVVQLTRGRADDSGGNLMLLTGSRPADMSVVFKQNSNSAVGFKLGAESFHAVGRVKEGTRFTVIYTFLADSTPEGKYRNFVAS
jgi:Rps23 Pro-64 3,4-dihydroxylase Tpa1-like proline 4-hydroxylase